MASIFLDRTIKASHSLREISKVRLFTRTPPVVDNWDPRGGWSGYLADVRHACVNANRGENKKERKSTP